MSQRHSEYSRIANDLYVTPQWVWDALYSVEGWAKEAWDCAPINADFDFLKIEADGACDSICTNPPFNLAEKFIRHALKSGYEKMAFLLPHAYDTAKGRVDLFNNLPFRCKWTLTQRIRWENLDQKMAGPSSNHAWYVWDWKYIGPARMGWL